MTSRQQVRPPNKLRCRLLALQPEDHSIYLNRCYAYRKIGAFDAAVQDYSAALLRAGSTVRLHNNCAYCLAKLGRYQEAIAAYDAVLELDGANVHALHNRWVCSAGFPYPLTHDPQPVTRPMWCTRAKA